MSTNIELEPDPRRLRLARNLRRVGVVALFVFLALGLAGFFDTSEDELSAGAQGVELSVSYPERVRGGLESSLEVEVSRADGLERPVDLAVTRDWLALFDVGSIDPQPDSESGDAERVIWTFEPPPAGALDVTVNLTLRPAVRGGEAASVAVLDGGEEVTSTSFETSVVP